MTRFMKNDVSVVTRLRHEELLLCGNIIRSKCIFEREKFTRGFSHPGEGYTSCFSIKINKTTQEPRSAVVHELCVIRALKSDVIRPRVARFHGNTSQNLPGCSQLCSHLQHRLRKVNRIYIMYVYSTE